MLLLFVPALNYYAKLVHCMFIPYSGDWMQYNEPHIAVYWPSANHRNIDFRLASPRFALFYILTCADRREHGWFSPTPPLSLLFLLFFILFPFLLITLSLFPLSLPLSLSLSLSLSLPLSLSLSLSISLFSFSLSLSLYPLSFLSPVSLSFLSPLFEIVHPPWTFT